MKNNKNFIRKLVLLACAAGAPFSMAMPVHATGLMGSELYNGTVSLIADATTIATILCPVVAGLLWGLFAVARQFADDEPTEKKWNKRMRNAIIFGIVGCLGSGIIAAISSYYVAA